jgi:hypothetical protein
MIYFGLDEEDKGPNKGGVGIVFDNNTRRNLNKWESISNRIITARFSANFPKNTIIQCYFPPEEAEIIKIKIIIGDLNALILFLSWSHFSKF